MKNQKDMPRRKGYWDHNDQSPDMNPPYMCSECGFVSETTPDYCQHCGADMREPDEMQRVFECEKHYPKCGRCVYKNNCNEALLPYFS